MRLRPLLLTGTLIAVALIALADIDWGFNALRLYMAPPALIWRSGHFLLTRTPVRSFEVGHAWHSRRLHVPADRAVSAASSSTAAVAVSGVVVATFYAAAAAPARSSSPAFDPAGHANMIVTAIAPAPEMRFRHIACSPRKSRPKRRHVD